MRSLFRTLLHQLGNGRALENARTERDELDRVLARLDLLATAA